MLRSLTRTAVAGALLLALAAPPPALAFDGQATPVQPAERSVYTQNELVEAGHTFFGETSAELATMIQNVFAEFGQPNGYVLGQEGSGAVIGGLRYGEGVLNTRDMGRHPVFWQGPSVGWDFGGSGSRVMMLVYHLPSASALYQRFTGVDGSAYVVGGLSMTVMAADDMILVPVRTGVGARLGVSIGYLKFTAEPTWNPF
ncbi:DUF1134 domain-containing protein [Acuticoccus mangrovi]|uniref:DUF1134 domain-containing protein n=1 Tax=Acuticoccus mangrovi TaxID=2796142 RepID=A0A934IPE2_9HYPH|nr:DUF1134 domain-containing protein [Acuticoccus mangrovi]MBJ3775164.1 DUF1134 domain-containing protein [Acuticoccus mangrovi]